MPMPNCKGNTEHSLTYFFIKKAYIHGKCWKTNMKCRNCKGMHIIKYDSA